MTFDVVHPVETNPVLFNVTLLNRDRHYITRTGIYMVPIDGDYALTFNLASEVDIF